MVVKRTKISLDFTPDKETSENIVHALFPLHDVDPWGIRVDRSQIRDYTNEKLQVAGKRRKIRESPRLHKISPEIIREMVRARMVLGNYKQRTA